MNHKKTVAERTLKKIIRRIVKVAKPEKIIMFGSAAKGQMGPNSDVDLLVIMPVNGSRRQTQVNIRCEIHDIPVSKDIVVVTPSEAERQRHLAGTIVRPAMREGKVLYEKPR